MTCVDIDYGRLPTIIGESGCNLMSKPMIIDERGETTNKIVDIKY